MEGETPFNNFESNQEKQFMPDEQLQQIVQSDENIQQQSFEQAPIQTRYAGFWIRFLANSIDGMIISVLLVVIIFPLVKINPFLAVAAYLLLPLLVWGYFIVMTNLYQATLGKRLFGLIVVQSDYSKVSLGKIILRETVGKIVSSMILSIGYIMVGFTQKKQALHDIIADTVVIYKDPNKKTKTWLIVLVLIFALIIPVGVGIAASVFFVSMNTAINKAQDAQKQSALKFENVQKQINTSVNNTNQSSSVNSAPASAPVSVTNSATAIAPATSGIDYSGKTAVLAINVDIKKYYSSKGTYKDYVAYVADFKESLPDYIYKKIADTTVDVSPDGKIFVIYYPIEGNTKQSWCIENNMPDAIISDTSLIQKTYHCK